MERALAGLVDHRLARRRGQFRHDLGAGLARDQHPPHRALVADAQGGVAPGTLEGRTIGEVRAVAFARMDHGPAGSAEPRDQPGHHGHDGAKRRDVVAERRAEPARLDEVALHVDDDERGPRGIDLQVEGVCGNERHQACPAMWRPISAMSAVAAGVS